MDCENKWATSVAKTLAKIKRSCSASLGGSNMSSNFASLAQSDLAKASLSRREAPRLRRLPRVLCRPRGSRAVLATDLISPLSPPPSLEDHPVVHRPAGMRTALDVRALHYFPEFLLTHSQSVQPTNIWNAGGRHMDGRSLFKATTRAPTAFHLLTLQPQTSSWIDPL